MKRVNILTNNSAHRRWILLGLKSHQYNSINKTTSIHYITTNCDEVNNRPISLVLLDGVDLIGRNYEKTKTLIYSGRFDNIFVVGDICIKSKLIENQNIIKLLFKQQSTEDSILRIVDLRIDFFSKIKYNIPLDFLYPLKDFFSHPKIISKILFQPRTIIFAGQTGKYSILEIFQKHIHANDDIHIYINYLESIFSNLSMMITCEIKFEELASYIINAHFEILAKMDDTYYARLQPFFKTERNTVIFKSIFRFVILTFLQKKDLLFLITYPESFVRVYNSNLYKKHLFIDFGGVNGYESLYPRTADLCFNKLDFYQFEQEGMKTCQLNLNIEDLSLYIETQINELIYKKNKKHLV